MNGSSLKLSLLYQVKETEESAASVVIVRSNTPMLLFAVKERGTDINKWRSVGVGVYIVHVVM